MQQGYAVDPTQALTSLGVGVLLAAVSAAAYTVVAWRLGRRCGREGLLLGWGGATLIVTTVAVASAVRNLAVFRPVASREVLSFVGLYVLVFAAGFGNVTWLVRRRLVSSSLAAPNAGTLALGVLSFFAALFVLALPVLIWDVSRLF